MFCLTKSEIKVLVFMKDHIFMNFKKCYFWVLRIKIEDLFPDVFLDEIFIVFVRIVFHCVHIDLERHVIYESM